MAKIIQGNFPQKKQKTEKDSSQGNAPKIIGRNDPCPCGSGKKYKKCCLEGHAQSSGLQSPQDVIAELKRQMVGTVSSLEEAQAMTKRFMEQRNNAPIADFCGLSARQMDAFLRFPFDSTDLATFASGIQSPEAPVMTLFAFLSEAIGEKGLKPTATGNLPQKFCRNTAEAFWGEETYQRRTRYGNIRTEGDFREMHCFRIVMEQAGLLRKYKGKFILSRNCRDMLVKQGTGAIYRQLFKTYTREFNWGYRDGYPEIPFIQQSFLFSLFLLQEYGGTFRPRQFYEDKFLVAFPAVLQEVPEDSYESPEETVRNCYSLRILENFAHFLGLIEIHETKDDILDRHYEIRKKSLLDEVVFFKV